MISLRLRLLLILLLAGGFALGVAAVAVRRTAHEEVDRLFDAHLVETARSMLAQYAHDYDETGHRGGVKEGDGDGDGDSDDGEINDDNERAEPYEQELRVFVYNRSERILYRAPDDGSAPFEPLDAGFHDVMLAGDSWRVYTAENRATGLWVSVGQRHAARLELAGEIASRILTPLAFLVPGLALLFWFGLGAGLKPLRELAASVAARTPDKLSPIDMPVPPEVKPLVDELNALLARLETAFAAERRFTADAAHELRTPLSALKTHAQVGLAAESDEERRRALTNVSLGADRAAHLVDQLLTLARLEPGLEGRRAHAVDLVVLAAQAVADASTKGGLSPPDVGLLPGSAGTVQGDSVLLGVLLRNLVDNAVRYGGGRIDVGVRQDSKAVVLEVCDTGRGIPPELRERVFDRFYRGLGHDAPGSGLGLSIVRRIADLHGGRVELAEGAEGRGLTVRVVLPVAAA